MDSKDRPDLNLPAVPPRFTAPRPVLLDKANSGVGAADEPAQSINLVKAALRAVTRHWWQILLLWAAGTGGICYLISTRIVPIYESVSILRVEPSPTTIFGPASSSESFMPFMETQVHLVLSPNVLSAALTDPRLTVQPSLRETPDAEATLRSLVKVMIVPNSYLLRVSMQSPAGPECATIVNGVVKSYLAVAAEWADGMTRAQIKSLESYQSELKVQADEKQEAWLALVGKGSVEMEFDATGQKAGSLPIPHRNRVTLDEYKRIRDELFRIGIAMSQAEAMVSMREEEHAQYLQSRPLAQGDENHEEKLMRSQPEVVEAAKARDRARAKYEECVRLDRTGRDPSTVSARKRYTALKDDYTRIYEARRNELMAKTPGGEFADTLTPPELRQARESLKSLQVSKQTYEGMLSKIEVSNRQEGTDQVRIALVREALASLKSMQEAVNTRLEQLRFESKGMARVSKVSEARANGIPIVDNRKKFLMVTPVAVLGLLIALFTTLEVKIGRVSDLDDLSKVSPTEVFAMPPLPGPRLESGQRGAREREAQLLEFLQSLDHLRVALSESSTGSSASRCLIVTSATESEGKTTLSAQLAACCAKAGISTLLVDADMRRCTLSRMLNETKSRGLSDVLQGETAEADVIVPVADAGFHLLPAGTLGRDPSWLLKGQRLGRLMSTYRQQFDMIIIDTPPVLPVPDALTLGRWTDGVVLATRYDFSRIALVLKARRRLNSAGIPLLKTVVNGVKTSRFYYGNGYGSYYGYASYAGYAPYDSRPHPQVDPAEQSTPA